MRHLSSSFLIGLLLVAAISSNGVGALLTVDFAEHHNNRMQDYAGAASQYPEGEVVLGSVAFNIPAGTNNVWNAEASGGANPRQIDITVGIHGVDTVYTLINTFWGEQQAGTRAALEFMGSQGAFFRKELDGNSDVRDFLSNVFTNTINGTTTQEVFGAGSGSGNRVRLDSQSIDLPVAFHNQTLKTIRVIDTGGTNFQRVFVAGVTVQTIPEPSSLAVMIASGVALLRRRTHIVCD